LSGPNPIVIGCGAERYHETAVDKGEAGFAFFARLPSKFPPGIAVPGLHVAHDIQGQFTDCQSDGCAQPDFRVAQFAAKSEPRASGRRRYTQSPTTRKKNATAGSATANSFSTEGEFIAYAATRLNVPAGTTVSGSTCTETEKAALIEATRELTNLLWQAQRTDSTQALAWPQRYALNPDAPSITGLSDIAELYFDDDEVPVRVKNAQIELALEFVRAGTTDLAGGDPNAGVIEETVGPLTTRWSAYARSVGLARFPRVMSYIAPMLASTAGSLELARS